MATHVLLRENCKQDGCTHREGCDCKSCSEDKSSGKEMEGANRLVAAPPPRDTAGTFSDNSRPSVRRPPRPDDDRGRGEDWRDTYSVLCCESKLNSAPGRGSIGNPDRSGLGHCLLEEGEKRGSTSTSGSADGVEAHVGLDGGYSEERSMRLRVAGDFVGNVFNACSSAASLSTSRSLK